MTNTNHTDHCDDGTGYNPDCTCDAEATMWMLTNPDGSFHYTDRMCLFCATQLVGMGWTAVAA